MDLLAIGETLVDFISVEQTDWLRNATTFRRYLGGSPANIAVNVAKLGGEAAVVSKTGIGAFAQFIKSELQRHGVSIDYLVMDHRNRTTVAFVSSTSGKPPSASSSSASAEENRVKVSARRRGISRPPMSSSSSSEATVSSSQRANVSFTRSIGAGSVGFSLRNSRLTLR